MISDAIRFIKVVRSKELELTTYTQEEILAFAKKNGYHFTTSELIKAHKSLYMLFKR